MGRKRAIISRLEKSTTFMIIISNQIELNSK